MSAQNKLSDMWVLDRDNLIVQHPHIEQAQLDKFQAEHWVMCLKCKELVSFGEACCGLGVVDPTSTGSDFDLEC